MGMCLSITQYAEVQDQYAIAAQNSCFVEKEGRIGDARIHAWIMDVHMFDGREGKRAKE
jgi:hypothetical protein